MGSPRYVTFTPRPLEEPAHPHAWRLFGIALVLAVDVAIVWLASHLAAMVGCGP